MDQQTQTQPATPNLFWDYAFADAWITVTDKNGCHIQVTQDELIPSDIPINKAKHIPVEYCGQEYWIPQELHFPM